MKTIACVGWVVYASQDPEGVAISVDSPLDVKVGDTFDLIVYVTNTREKSVFSLSDIDISEDYLENFVVVSVKPTAKSSMHVPPSGGQVGARLYHRRLFSNNRIHGPT